MVPKISACASVWERECARPCTCMYVHPCVCGYGRFHSNSLLLWRRSQHHFLYGISLYMSETLMLELALENSLCARDVLFCNRIHQILFPNSSPVSKLLEVTETWDKEGAVLIPGPLWTLGIQTSLLISQFVILALLRNISYSPS